MHHDRLAEVAQAWVWLAEARMLACQRGWFILSTPSKEALIKSFDRLGINCKQLIFLLLACQAMSKIDLFSALLNNYVRKALLLVSILLLSLGRKFLLKK